MRRRWPLSMLLGSLVGWSLALPGCINAASAPNSDQSDANPLSTNNLLAQASLQAVAEVAQSADADLGSTVALEVKGGTTCLVASTLPAQLQADDLPTTFSVAWSLHDCPLYIEALESGSRSESVMRVADANRAVHQLQTATTRSITLDYFDGSQLLTQGQDTMLASGLRRAGSISRTGSLSAARTLFLGDGTEAYKLTSTYNFEFTDSYASLRLTQRLLAGTGTLQQANGTTTVATYTDLTYDSSTCCYPVAGQLTHRSVSAAGDVTEKAYVFGPACGKVTLTNGTAVTLAPCN